MSLIIRPYTPADLDDISRIYDEYYSHEYNLPNLERTLTNAVVADGNTVVGFGLVKLWAEAIMVLDKGNTTRNKPLAFDMLMQHALKASKHYKIDKLYAVVADPKFQAVMEKHFDFKPISDTVLVKEITDG